MTNPTKETVQFKMDRRGVLDWKGVETTRKT